MENFNLVQLSAPVAVKDISSDFKALPQKSSEKEFSGVLAQEESHAGEVKDDAVNRQEQRKPVERETKKNSKAGGAGHKSVKNESSKKTTENRDDDTQETGTNVFAAVPADDVVEKDPAKDNQLTEFADNVKTQALLTKMTEAIVTPMAQTEVSKSSVSEINVIPSEAHVADKILFNLDHSGNNELDDGETKCYEELAGGDSVTKLFPANATAEKVVEKVVEKVAEKLPTPGAKNEVSVAESEKKKIVKNHKVENTKIAAVQNIVSDISAAAGVADSTVVNSEKDRQHQVRVTERLSSPGGVSLNELPDEVEIHIASEIVASDEKMQRKANFSDRLSNNRFLSTSEAGTVHLQGRARENQPSLMQNGQGQKDLTAFAEGENSRGKAVFMDELKSSFSEKITAESVLQSGSKEKPALDTNFSKSELLAGVNSDLSNASVVKKSAGSILSKPLPVSDEHLLDQIQAGLTRQVNGRQTVTIKLWPEHLGRVDVKLVMNKQHLTATFMVDHPDVKDAMMRKVESLRDSLGLRGIDAKDISIKVAPAKSGDGTSLMTDSQQHNSSAWRQFNQGNSGNNNSGSQPGWDDNPNAEPLLAGTDLIENISSLTGDVLDAGSLHITA